MLTDVAGFHSFIAIVSAMNTITQVALRQEASRGMTGQGMCPKTDQMPVGGSLTSAEIQTVVDWICAGALDD